ncbi:MAG: CopG family transcriptional regulator [Thermoprotei archaeon]|nr:MAG: CopG family transcriptional regulator [Thermoprotei archaeon]
MKAISVRIPEQQLRAIDELVKKGLFESRSDFIRRAIRCYFREEYMMDIFGKRFST